MDDCLLEFSKVDTSRASGTQISSKAAPTHQNADMLVIESLIIQIDNNTSEFN